MKVLNGQGSGVIRDWLLTRILLLACRLLPLPLPGVFYKPALRKIIINTNNNKHKQASKSDYVKKKSIATTI